MSGRKKSSANKITNTIVKHLSEANKEKEWVYNAIAHAGDELVKLQNGHWKLHLQELQEEFSDDLFANQCAIIKTLYRWQVTQERIGMRTPWNTVLEAIKEARGGSPNLRLIHINQAKNTFAEESTTRKRKATQEGDGSPSSVKRSRRGQSIANAGGISWRNRSQRENENAKQKYGVSVQKKRIGTRSIGDERQENEEVVQSQNGNTTGTNPLRRSIGLGGLEHSPIRSDTQQSLNESPEQGLVPDERTESRVSVARPEGSDDEVQSNRSLYNPPTPHYGGVLDGFAASTEHVDEEMSNEDLHNSPAPGRRPSTVVIEDMEASEVNDIEKDIRSTLEDLRSPPSLSGRSIHFFLEKLLPTKSVHVFDADDVPNDCDLSSWPRSQIKDVRGKDFVLAPVCVKQSWVLFVFDLVSGDVTVLESVKSEAEDNLLEAIRQSLERVIGSAEGAEHIVDWIPGHEILKPSPRTATEDFGIQVLVNCFQIATGKERQGESQGEEVGEEQREKLMFQPVDTILWRALLSSLINEDAWRDLMGIWASETTLSYSCNASNGPSNWPKEVFPRVSAIKDRLDAAVRLNARIANALKTQLPHIEGLFVSLFYSTTDWRDDVSDKLKEAEHDAFRSQRIVGDLQALHGDNQFESHTTATELGRITAMMEKFHQRHAQRKVERLQSHRDATEKMRKLHEYMFKKIVDASRFYLMDLDQRTGQEVQTYREELDRVELADIEEYEKATAELENEIKQRKTVLAIARKSRARRQSEQGMFRVQESETSSPTSSRFG